jgi:hypothetical protein
MCQAASHRGKRKEKIMKKQKKARLKHEAEGGAAGALVGAAAGAIAGPPGAVVGAILGAAVGSIAGSVLEQNATDAKAIEGELDREIGVSGGELGAPNLDHPAPKTGAYSAASAGAAASGDEEPAEGPIQTPS